MKHYLFLVLVLFSLAGFSQTKGMSFQAVILDPQKQQLPGFDAEKNILSNSAIALQFTITDDSNRKLYQERHRTSTDAYGMINLMIGSGTQTLSFKFDDLVWDGLTKYLAVDIDFTGNGNFIPLSKQALTYMPQPINNETKQAIAELAEKIESIELTPGPEGIPGSDGDPLSFLSVSTNILPSDDNTYSLGSEDRRWAGVHVGPGSIYITDITLETNTELTVDNGVLKINGANQLQVGQLKFVDNRIESASPSIDIQIGDLDDNADLVLNRNMVIGLDKGLKFQDNSVQLTAAVNADWNAESGPAQILNKPILFEGASGPVGPAGLTGPAGPAGIQGLQGETGAAGTNGADGAQGLQGVTGATGPQGATGTKGDTGTAGPQGETGAAGTNGADGADGAQGIQGEIGAAGTNGADGADGAQGLQGETGAAGPQGAIGPAGPQGATGTKGDTGTAGPQGIQGETGAAGTNGADGADGSQGLQGEAGTAGTNGADGAQGLQGIQGETGPQGLQGVTGATGPQGATGPEGPAATEVSFTTNFSVVSGTEPVGEQVTSSYIKNGALVFITMNFDLSNVSNFGTGQYTVTLPFAPKYDFLLSSGHIHSANKDDDYGVHAELTAGSTVATLVYTGSGGKDEPLTKTKPKTLTISDDFHISGSYIAQ